jgi:hypothetical protein
MGARKAMKMNKRGMKQRKWRTSKALKWEMIFSKKSGVENIDVFGDLIEPASALLSRKLCGLASAALHYNRWSHNTFVSWSHDHDVAGHLRSCGSGIMAVEGVVAAKLWQLRELWQ